MSALKNLKLVRRVAEGFTLIELLIVMAILGVLAIVVLIAINPVQQLARTRDAGRKSAITQMGHALEAYFTSHNGFYLTAAAANCPGLNGGWITCLEAAGELSTVPSTIDNNVGNGTCTSNVQNLYCYDVAGAGSRAVAFTRLESESEISKCGGGTNPAFFVWSTEDGRGGLVCSATEPVPGNQTWNPVQ